MDLPEDRDLHSCRCEAFRAEVCRIQSEEFTGPLRVDIVASWTTRRGACFVFRQDPGDCLGGLSWPVRPDTFLLGEAPACAASLADPLDVTHYGPPDEHGIIWFGRNQRVPSELLPVIRANT